MSSSQNNHMWFNLCILNELVPPTIDLEENPTVNRILNLPKEFVDWKACCISRYGRSVECANVQSYDSTAVHQNSICGL